MASIAEARVVKMAAVAQGVALVNFPAASTIFTSASDYALSRSAYGAMFVPQAITAVGASILGASWSGRVGTRRIYLIGLAANVKVQPRIIDDMGPSRSPLIFPARCRRCMR